MVRSATLVNSYIASARAAEATNAGQLAWLEAKRAALSEELEAGDWEVSGSSYDGKSSTARREASASTRLEAVFEAIRILTADPNATAKPGSGIIIPRFSGIPHG
jgi:DNA-binding GntR family transcriptional regulator